MALGANPGDENRPNIHCPLPTAHCRLPTIFTIMNISNTTRREETVMTHRLSDRPRNRAWVLWVAFLLVLPAWCFAASLPQGFVYVDELIPTALFELRYCTENNFMGQRVDGYLAPRCILTRQAAEALRKVQDTLAPFGLGIKIFDAYRPQRAVNHFVRWGRDLKDIRMKAAYYPNVDKDQVFEQGYIATRSGHSRGSTVDLTIVSLAAPHEELDMGSGFDFFGPESWPENRSFPPAQRAHRMLLQTVMKQNGFKPYDKEWWHFTLADEPFPDTYFDFPVE